ncbi:hypothetical protein N0V85_005173 [Neurospora sp. IMI 360204]|nr:hypothetical protein N0V85_005173 [Neurospora sp. IMI 360204]
MHKFRDRMSSITDSAAAHLHLDGVESLSRSHTPLHFSRQSTPQPPASPIGLLRSHVHPFPSLSEALADPNKDILRYFDSFSSAKVLLIGDSSHGTSEFYAFRAALTRYMIEHHGYTMVACEADWPDAESIDRYVRRRPGPGPPATIESEAEARRAGRELSFMRFPRWMWRNKETHEFVEWLRCWNKGKDVKKEAVGFYGLDLYSMGSSMRAVINYLEHVDKDMAEKARQSYWRLHEWSEDPHEYGLETLVSSGKGFKGYEDDVVQVLQNLLSKRLEYERIKWDGDEFHGAEQNARLVKDAEHYYRAMYYARDESWNLRDTHMFQTLQRTLDHRGSHSKAIVWAHNSHIGDARTTSMGWSADEINVGQLCREAYGKKALSIGCLGYTGKVAAAKRWDGDMSVMHVKPALPNSYERLMHDTGIKNFVLDLRTKHCDKALREALMEKRLERFIGVIYAPATERQSHYSFAVLPEQLDGIVYFDETEEVGALEVHQPPGPLEFDETWPFGL